MVCVVSLQSSKFQYTPQFVAEFDELCTINLLYVIKIISSMSKKFFFILVNKTDVSVVANTGRLVVFVDMLQ